MTLYKGKYRVETTRLPAYDYGSPGWYHVVICTHERVRFFGEVIRGTVRHSDLGRLAHRCCADIPTHFAHAAVDAFVVMPDHVHVLIGILRRGDAMNGDAGMDGGSDARSRVATMAPPDGTHGARAFGPLHHGALPTIVHAYKSSVTRWARRHGHTDFAWQPRYYECIIRNERQRAVTRRYIEDNPRRWYQARRRQ